MAYQASQQSEEGVAGPSGAVYYAQPPPASPYAAPYGSSYAQPMHAYAPQHPQQHQQQQHFMPPQYMSGMMAQQQVYYPHQQHHHHQQQQQHGYGHPAAYGSYAPYGMPGHQPAPPQAQQHHASPHQARLPPKPHALPSSPSAATLSPSGAHLSGVGASGTRASPRSPLIPLPLATSKLIGPAARLPALPPKASIPERDAEDELEKLRAALEAAQKREEAWELRLEALGMQPSLALQAHRADLGEEVGEDGETKEGEKQEEGKTAPVLGVRLLQRVHALQVENEELGEMLARKLGLDESQSEPKEAKPNELEDAMRLVSALDAALTRATTRAEQAERALAVACAQNSRSLLEDESLKLNNVRGTASTSTTTAAAAALASVDATPTASAEASTTASTKSSPRTSLSALSSSGAVAPLTNGDECQLAPAAAPTAPGGRGRGRGGGGHRGAQRGAGGRGSLPARGAWNTGRGA